MNKGQSTEQPKTGETSSVAAYLKRVNALEREGMYEEAIESLQKVIDLAPNSAKHRIHLANLYHAQRRIDRAIDAMQRAVELDPKNASCHESLLQFYLELGEYDRAIDFGRKLLRKFPRNLYARDILGVAYLQKGDFAHSIDEFIRVVEMDPDGDMSDNAREAIIALDGYQLRQIVTLAVEDPLFRARLSRDPEDAVRQRGFSLSMTGMMALRQIEFDLLLDPSLQQRQMFYH
jgi:tetratricopeptide (TPR) repeat protein